MDATIKTLVLPTAAACVTAKFWNKSPIALVAAAVSYAVAHEAFKEMDLFPIPPDEDPNYDINMSMAIMWRVAKIAAPLLLAKTAAYRACENLSLWQILILSGVTLTVANGPTTSYQVES